MSMLKAATARPLRVGVAAGLAAATVIGFATASSATAITLVLSPTTGPNTGAVIAVTGSGFTDAAGASQLYSNAAGIQFNSAAACPAAPATPAAGSVYNVTTKSIISSTRLVVTAPSMTLGTANAAKAYYLCVYHTATALLGSAKYTVYAPPTITSVTPASGPTFGGQTVTVVGTGFTAKTTATAAGVALTGIKVATDGLSFTGVVPARAAGTVDLVATTEGGPATVATSTFNDYDYVPAVTVSPQTGKNATATTITVKGVGFSAMSFSGAARVYFVAGKYDPSDDGSGAKTLAEATSCANVQVVSDTELVCDTPSTKSDIAYTVTVVNDNTVDANTLNSAYLQSVVSSAATFTFSSF